MRAATLPLVVLALGACWDGAEALHKPCAVDDHCGRDQECLHGYCERPGTEPLCERPTPPTCDPSKRVTSRNAVASELRSDVFGRATAVVAGAFLGDEGTDLAVLSFDNYSVSVLENEGSGSWPVAASYFPDASTELYDLVAADIDCDGTTEFLLLSRLGTVDVLHWDGADFSVITILDLPSEDLFSCAAADVLGDGRPELVASGSSAVHVVPNVEGMLVDGDATSVSGTFYEPWDTLVVGMGASARILVPVSNDQSTGGTRNQRVQVLRIEDDAPEIATALATDFQNPWTVAEGDFLGDDRLEIAVADRRLNVPLEMEGTTNPGLVRFFRLDDDEVIEVGDAIEVGIGPGVLAAADLDCDGKTDLVIGNSGAPGMYDAQPQVLFGSSESSARADDLLDFPSVGETGVGAGSRMAVGDFDRDGLLEVAIPDFGVPEIESSGRRLVFVGLQGGE